MRRGQRSRHLLDEAPVTSMNFTTYGGVKLTMFLSSAQCFGSQVSRAPRQDLHNAYRKVFVP